MALADQITLLSKLSNLAIEVNKTTVFMHLYGAQVSKPASMNIDFVEGVVINDINLKEETITVIVRYSQFKEAEGNEVWFRDCVITFDQFGCVTNWRISDDEWDKSADAPHALGDKIYK